MLSAAPLCVLPAKDDVEEMFFRSKTMSPKINMMVTFTLVAICYILGLFIPSIGDAMTIVGSTTNPLVIKIILDSYRMDLSYPLFIIGKSFKINH